MKKEKKIVIILDNYRVYKSKLVKTISKQLNIELIFLSPYSPKLNPIEQVWRTIKRKLSCFYFKDVLELIKVFEKTFVEIVDNESFYKNWIKKFMSLN